VVNGLLTRPKERRSFKPKVESSILSGRIPLLSRQRPAQSRLRRFLSNRRSAFRRLPTSALDSIRAIGDDVRDGRH
jgi:hypothetical protein